MYNKLGGWNESAGENIQIIFLSVIKELWDNHHCMAI